MILRITAQHFCAGLVLGLRAAPIVKYMRDWELWRIEEYCRRKGWRLERIDGNHD